MLQLERNLDRTRRLLFDLGDPQNSLRIVHVAGSKGKATTSTHIANILIESGFRTGLFTSPHLQTWRERIAVDGVSISQDDFGLLGGEVLAVAESIEIEEPPPGPVNAFEVLLGIAALHFRQQQCEFAVFEVGLGGRFDATNVVSPEVIVITELEMEHVAILGPLIADIAWNKGGIIKRGAPVVALRPPPDAVSVLDMIAHAASAPMLMEYREWTWSAAGPSGIDVQLPHRLIQGIVPPAPGDHQRRNAALASVAVSQLRGSELPPADDAIRRGIRRTHLPGHFEVVENTHGRIVLDVAHTPRSVELLLAALAETGIERPRVIAGFLADKDIQAIVSVLAPIASEVILLPVQSPRSASIEELNEVALRHPRHVRTASQLSSNLLTAGSQPAASEWTVVTGSSALVAEARQWLGLAESAP